MVLSCLVALNDLFAPLVESNHFDRSPLNTVRFLASSGTLQLNNVIPIKSLNNVIPIQSLNNVLPVMYLAAVKPRSVLSY